MPEKGRYVWGAGGIRREGATADICHLGAGMFNIRSIPPRASTGMGRGSPQRGYGATSSGRNHSRPTLTTPGPSVPFIPETVEPLLDVFDEGDRLVVVAEVPGAEEDSIRVEIEDHTLKLWARGKCTDYRGEVRLPGETQPASPVWTLNNGVIRLRLARRKRGADGRRRPSGG